jgi:succinate dehydrogenase/fumarate reductase cytochrome b subunit
VAGAVARLRILPVFEAFFFIALGFHVLFGLRLLRRKNTPDVDVQRYGDRRLWSLQRLSAVVLLGFVLIHLWQLRVQKLLFGAAPDLYYTILSARLSWTWAGVPWMALVYVIGVAAACVHFVNGLRATLRTRTGWPSIAAGVLLFLIGTTTVVAIATGTRLLPAADADSAPCGSSGR